MKNVTIGLIGSGNMARALIVGLLNGDYVDRKHIVASDHKEAKAHSIGKEFGISTTTNNREVAKKADIVILAVKPQVLSSVVREISKEISPKKLLVSIAAGVSTEVIESHLGKASKVIRVMPNVPALVGHAATALAKGAHATDDDLDVAKAIFDAVGITVVVDEVQMDAVTGLSGSGPAYIFLLIDSLADAGVKVGLSRSVALELAANTVLGAAKLLIESREHPGQLKDRVTSPGGTAIAGIHTLEEGGFRTTLMNAVERATFRSRELGLQMKGK